MATKQERLIESATALFYQQGVANTTLADIAEHAEVPLGNVYYHFRTKEALIAAVIQHHVQSLHALFAQWEPLPDPRERLIALLATERQETSLLTRYGCPQGSLVQELDKADAPLSSPAAQVFETYLAWVRSQLHLLRKTEEEANDLAVEFLASLQGAILISCSLRNPAMLERKLHLMEAWVRTL